MSGAIQVPRYEYVAHIDEAGDLGLKRLRPTGDAVNDCVYKDACVSLADSDIACRASAIACRSTEGS
jgi:hypothetical protein